MKADNILKTIGKTPHIRLRKLFGNKAEVWIKLENKNPGASIKDRIALSMIENAEKQGFLKKGSVIIEATSGNTGIGLSLVAAVKNYRIIIVMPESMSIERQKLMRAYGAELVLTPSKSGMKGSIEKANELSKKIKNSWLPKQFENLSNPEIHRKTTALEIKNDFPDGIDYLISGAGTGGHITAVSEVLKQAFPQMKTFVVEPHDSQVIAGKKAQAHEIQGIGAGFIPDVMNVKTFDGTISVCKDEAFLFAANLAKKEGILAGISTGASLAAISKIINKIPKKSKIITFAYDTGERYLSVDGLF